MNIQRQKTHKGKIEEGDYFSILLQDGRHILGRMIRHQPNIYPILNEYLVYIYAGTHETVDPIPNHSPTRLMLPPLFVNKMGWTKGYFSRLRSSPLLDGDTLKIHCFSGCYFSPTGFINEFGEPVHRSEPCGAYGLDNYKMIDYYISEKLGLDLSKAGVED